MSIVSAIIEEESFWGYGLRERFNYRAAFANKTSAVIAMKHTALLHSYEELCDFLVIAIECPETRIIDSDSTMLMHLYFDELMHPYIFDLPHTHRAIFNPETKLFEARMLR